MQDAAHRFLDTTLVGCVYYKCRLVEGAFGPPPCVPQGPCALTRAGFFPRRAEREDERMLFAASA